MSYNHAATQMRWHNDWNINALDEGLGRKTRAAQRLSCATGHQNPGTLERQMKQLSLVTATRCGNKKGHPNPFLEKTTVNRTTGQLKTKRRVFPAFDEEPKVDQYPEWLQ